MDIHYYNRETKLIELEKVYGEAQVKWLYSNPFGKILAPLVCNATISSLYGHFQSSSLFSQRKIIPFIEKFQIDMDEYSIPENGFKTFNEFFIRKFKKGKRPFPTSPNILGAPAEARYFAFNQITDEITLPVKGHFLSPKDLIHNEKWQNTFNDGPLLLARLCPTDYHRFHFPDHGVILHQETIPGVLHSVNPIALKNRGNIFIKNERQVSILQTKNFGKLAYIEVGATMVGKIVQSHQGKSYRKGDEKGYFLFGGSTVIVIGEKGRWAIDQDILEQSQKGTECFIKLGAKVAQAL